MGWSGSGSVIQDQIMVQLHQRNRSIHSGHRFIGSFDVSRYERPWITDPDPDHGRGSHSGQTVKPSNLWSLNPGRTNSDTCIPKRWFQPSSDYDKDLLKSWYLSVLSPWLLWLELAKKSYKGYNKGGLHAREEATVSFQPWHLIPIMLLLWYRCCLNIQLKAVSLIHSSLQGYAMPNLSQIS